jgi:hypothetical protein
MLLRIGGAGQKVLTRDTLDVGRVVDILIDLGGKANGRSDSHDC